MSLLDWLFRRPRFRRFDDSYAMDFTSMLAGVRKALVQQRAKSDSIWLVVHFPETFLRLQQLLESENLDYEVVEARLSASNAHVGVTVGGSDECCVRLVMSALLEDEDRAPVAGGSGPVHRLAMIVCDRHPAFHHEQKLLSFANKLPPEVELGYVLSLDDYVVKQIVSPMTRTVLEQLGMNQQELIASNFLTRRLDAKLKKDAALYLGDQPADSAEEWVRINSRTK